MMGEIADNRQAVERVVQERAGWVFAAARRRVGDAALAEDVTQAVFLLYWRRRPGESRRERARVGEGERAGEEGKVAGWLHRAVRYCSANALRLRQIHQRHEREAAMQKKEKMEGTEGMADWTEVEAELEGAMDRLSEKDREVVLLRFYEQRPLAEVGRVLGISEKAAQKRVERAVEKLRGMLGKKWVRGTAAGLSAVLVGNVVGEMPEGLVGRIVSAAGSGGGSTVAAGIAKGAMKMMVVAKVKVVAVVVGLAVTLAVVAGVATTRSSEQAVASGMSVPALPGAVTVVGAEKEALLQDVLRLRTATRAAVVSGRGTAHLETSEQREAKLGEPNPSLANHEVQFAFRGNDSLVTGGVEFNATALLVTDLKVIRYYAGLPGRPAPAAVSIMRPEPVGGYAVDLPRWSFQEISRLPRALSSNEMEPQLFAWMAKMSEARVEKSGSIVRVTVEPPRPATVLRDVRLLEFDLERGGMMTRYHYEDSRTLAGERHDSKEDWQVSWTNVKGAVLPSSRTRIWELYRNGKFSQRYGNKISFDTFTVEDVPADQITIEHMGIASGTSVVDAIANKDSRYMPDGGR